MPTGHVRAVEPGQYQRVSHQPTGLNPMKPFEHGQVEGDAVVKPELFGPFDQGKPLRQPVGAKHHLAACFQIDHTDTPNLAGI